MTAPSVSAGEIEDLAAAPLLMSLKDCLVREAARTKFGPVRDHYLAWGVTLPAQDGCLCDDEGNGEAWVKLDSFGPDLAAGGGNAGNGWCPPGWVALISLGIYRCVPTPEGDEVLAGRIKTDISLALHSDKAALFRTLACCDQTKNNFRGGDFLPIDAAGGCAGGMLTLQLPLMGGGCPA